MASVVVGRATVSRVAILLVALVVPIVAPRAAEPLESPRVAARRLFRPVVPPANTASAGQNAAPQLLDFPVTAPPDELPAPSELAAPAEVRDGADGSIESAVESVEPGDRLAQLAAGCSVWYVSTRELPLDGDPACQAPHLHYETYVSGAGWAPATLDELLASDDSHTRTTIYVHGNWATEDDARYTGLKMQELLTAGACMPWRFVIFTWPADRCDTTAVKDARLKAGRSEAQSYYLAWLLDRLDPEVPVTLVGYSYGTRLIASGLHLLGGGGVHHHRLADRVHPERSGLRAILIAAAIDANCFAVDGRYSAAMSTVECVLATVNARDPYLRYYSLLYGAGGPPALGYKGVIEANKLGAATRLVSQMEVSHSVRRHHSLNHYVDAPEVLAELRYFTQAEAIATAPSDREGEAIDAVEVGAANENAPPARAPRWQRVGLAR
ncbi:MAG: hypothetical protein K2Y37_05195 [Pirellulales bacterium]|nr:hypothetical protein [Pirellulales bacterium]